MCSIGTMYSAHSTIGHFSICLFIYFVSAGLLNRTSASDFLEMALLACYCSIYNHGFDMLSSFSAIVQHNQCPPIGLRTLRAGLIKSVLLSVYSSRSREKQQINSSHGIKMIAFCLVTKCRAQLCTIQQRRIVLNHCNWSWYDV